MGYVFFVCIFMTSSILNLALLATNSISGPYSPPYNVGISTVLGLGSSIFFRL
jgi:hypothetical protein